MNSPEQLSARQFAEALQQLADRITEKQWKMLYAHYNAPNRSITARQLAKQVGFKNYGAVNLQYGRLGGLLGSMLGFDERNSSMLATFIKPNEKDHSEWLWVMLPALAMALETIRRVGLSEDGAKLKKHPLPTRQGRDLSIEKLASMAGKLPWVIPNVFIMPPHEYVVEKKLGTKEEREAFAALCDSCAHHPSRWKAFFRAYKAKNSYIEIGEYRYWYSQIGGARMMNRSYREHEIENIRGAEGDRAVKNWSGCTYAWRREYGVECENLHRYCNLIVVEAGSAQSEFTIVRYAAMVLRNAVTCWQTWQQVCEAGEEIETNIRNIMQGVEAVDGIRPANSKQVSCSDEEMKLKAVWMSHKGMDVSRVATDLRWFSTAPQLELERIFALPHDCHYIIQLNVPSV
jgi:hypothetical protein